MPIPCLMTPASTHEKDLEDGEAYVGIGRAARYLGVSPRQLRRWDADGIFIPDRRTLSGHRRYSVRQLKDAAVEWQGQGKQPLPCSRRRKAAPLPFESDD
jgi:hypothetical protein